MLSKLVSTIFGIIVLGLMPMATPVHAQQPVELKGDVKVVKTTTDKQGKPKEELLPPDVVVPGDRLVFSTSYMNNGVEPVENFVVYNPIPSAVRLADDADPDLTVSVDGGKNWGRLAELVVVNEDGTSRPAQTADVTHIRWTLAVVEPGQGGRLEYPAIIR